MLSLLSSSVPLDQLQLPAGFEIAVYADGLENARAMALSDNGTLFVGSRRAGKLYAARDNDNDGVAEQVVVLDRDLELPTGLVWVNDSLYVAALSKIVRYDGLAASLDAVSTPTVIVDDLPTERHHGWKYLELGPDGKLYFGIGAPCNICLTPGFATIERVNLDGSQRETVALGVRNTVGLAFHPDSGKLWFTDNGRDMLGDDLPPDELNRLDVVGQHFGYPYCHGRDVKDPEFGDNVNCAGYTAPVQLFGAHVAPLGLDFYTGTLFPAAYQGHLFVAEHGSWNRSSKVGYQVSLVRLDGEEAVSYEPFITGWLQGQDNWGRPADVLQHPDGSLLISDDQAGVVYRVTYAASEGDAGPAQP